MLARWRLFPLLIVALVFLGSQPAVAAPPPRLVVLVVFDQLRGDYLGRWQSLFGADGFRRLLTRGAWFTNCNYPYAYTRTGAGHASILTGCTPAEHGIVDNEWFDRTTGAKIDCVGLGRYERVPAAHGPARPLKGKQPEKPNISPEHLLAPTVTDVLKDATSGKSRVISLSLKDRAAVLPAGRHPDACYWFSVQSGDFVTSTYYRFQPHAWVAAFNHSRAADCWFGQSWDRLRPDLDYVRHSGPDDVPGESKGRVFPHPLSKGQSFPDSKYYEKVFCSPFGSELLLDLAFQAIEAERLGHHDTPDFLSLSFSSNDAVGHYWGPDSQEVLDVTLRSDLIIQRLVAYLDQRVGKDRYVLALTADHGICPLPEVSRQQGRLALRVSPDLLQRDAESYLDARYGPCPRGSKWLLATSDFWIYLNHGLLRQRGLRPAEVEATLAAWLKGQPGILTAYTRTQLTSSLNPADELGEMARRAFFPHRSGDVAFVLKPYCLLTSPLSTGTTHGTPHEYDTHVPLIFYGPGVRPGIHSDRITPLATAAALAHALHIHPPARAMAGVPTDLFTTP
jgi:predicted AlkP superfamily pyrophosphatase or phosphodiesterase